MKTTMQPAWAINNGINQNKLHTESIKQCWNKASEKKTRKALCFADRQISFIILGNKIMHCN